MFSLKDKVIAITGAGSGIGYALTELALDAGAKVAASDIKPDALAALAARYRQQLHQAVLDVSDREAFAEWSREVVAHFGCCDVIINNAGVSLSSRVQSMKRDDLEWIMNINFWGVVNGVEAFLPHLLTRPEAVVVNISSLFGLMAVPSQSAYNAAKFAVRGYSESMRQDLRDTSVKVVTVHPGGVKTNIVANGKHYESLDGSHTNTEESAAMFERIASTTPQRAAEIILRGVEKGKPRVLIGRDAILLDLLQRFLPGLYDRLTVPVSLRGRHRMSSQ
ncbi:NADP-dependent 3-hydroxy acid dehydrogenase YdfG [Litorivivens lipolytica]|uniref:NADP-dependent 3-hydroxy acid dehydrogenase YdfG n=1 Tax=Litorivivens lipolytica TaxID=1524264 RepID=A0A7W4W2K3_9GAMM|nr:SDR family NAD(P)-dependent oxidoreductase [Litorivivens lipolytica]MBB3045988.1 NADP-dependent 3-hydroxy acid dehydrogenase YdfG [Litorivivens lipolytica]